MITISKRSLTVMAVVLAVATAATAATAFAAPKKKANFDHRVVGQNVQMSSVVMLRARTRIVYFSTASFSRAALAARK